MPTGRLRVVLPLCDVRPVPVPRSSRRRTSRASSAGRSPVARAAANPTRGSHERRAALRHDAWTPAVLSAPRSQIKDINTNATKNDSAVHFTAQAHPNITPATSRHGRGPSIGAPSIRSAPSASRAARRPRICSRSRTSAPKPARMNSCRKMSSSATRDCTTDTPSRASSSPAMPPKRFEWNIRRAIRVISSTLTMPARAGASRKAKSLSLSRIHCGSAISHLPSGGWTMNM